MKVFTQAPALRRHLHELACQKVTLGFVPTMGALHEGHLSLVRESKSQCGVTIASVFVNPLQFSPGEDYARYPRQVENDAAMLEELGTDIVFLPTVEEIAPQNLNITVHHPLAQQLCGLFRPNFFDGICTVICKFLNIINPDKIFLGKKDYQQLTIIKDLIKDLNYKAEVIGMSTVRDTDGLALSSRNAYLDGEQRQQALMIHRSLMRTQELVKSGKPISCAQLQQNLFDELKHAPGVSLRYAEIRSAENLHTLEQDAPLQGTAVAMVSAMVGTTNLIDNIELSS